MLYKFWLWYWYKIRWLFDKNLLNIVKNQCLPKFKSRPKHILLSNFWISARWSINKYRSIDIRMKKTCSLFSIKQKKKNFLALCIRSFVLIAISLLYFIASYNFNGNQNNNYQGKCHFEEYSRDYEVPRLQSHRITFVWSNYNRSKYQQNDNERRH